MQAVDIVRIKKIWPPYSLVPDQEVLHRRSKTGNHLLLIEDKWKPIFEQPRLLYRWREIRFKEYFEYVRTVYVKNHKESFEIRIESFPIE